MFSDAEFMPFIPREKPSFLAVARNFLENYPWEAYRTGYLSFPGTWPFVPKNHILLDPPLIEEMLISRAEEFRRDDMTMKAMSGPINAEALFFAEGADWKWQRRALAPAFRHENLMALVPTFTQCAQAQSDEWRARLRVAPDAPVDANAATSAATFAIIQQAVLGASDGMDHAKFFAAMSPSLQTMGWRMLIALFGFSPNRVPHPGSSRARAAEKYLHEETAHILAERRARGAGAEAGKTILELLLAAKDPETGRVMTDAELVGNLYGFMLAGHETSAVALGWALWLLAKDQASQERLRAEVAAVAGDAPIGPEHIEQLVFTRCVVQEAMRLFPPAAALGRQPRHALTLGDIAMAPNEPIYVLIWCLHRSERLWDNPGAFDPDRFSPERSKGRHRCAYLPFGGGPRICIGMGFAMLEMVAILATLTRDWRLATVPGHKVELAPALTTRAKGGLPLRIAPVRA
jgi:cytochrome P450